MYTDTGVVYTYVNGALADTQSNGSVAATGVGLIYIGKHNNDAGTYGTKRFFNGLIDEVEVFQDALSPSQIQAIYRGGVAGKCKTADDTNPVVVNDATINFSTDSPGVTITDHTIDPNSAGVLPAGYSISANTIAYDITASDPMAVAVPLDICFHLPYIHDQPTFRKTKILHGIVFGGSTTWEDITQGYDPVALTICGHADSLSPFILAENATAAPTAAPATVSGRVTTVDGAPLGGVTVRLEGAQSLVGITDIEGKFAFADLQAEGFYTVMPLLANFSFSPSQRSFSLVGSNTDAVFTATASATQTSNPLDTPEYFVRQQYLDFLGREPDQAGLQFWSSKFDSCVSDAGCIRDRRIDVSAAFFQSTEFQDSGYYIYRLYQASLGRQPSFAEFTSDRPRVIGGADLDSKRQAFVEDWISRSAFTQLYGGLSNSDYAGRLFTTAGLDSLVSERQAETTALDNGSKTRAQVLNDVIEIQTFKDREFNPAFVLMQYYGYLRRDADRGGYEFWLDVFTNRDAGNYRGMVCSFITSDEYQRRFSTVLTYSNSECAASSASSVP